MDDYILIIPWLPLLIFSVNRKSTDQQLVSQCSTRVKGKKCTRKAMIVYDKKLSSQWNLTAQIKQVHYKRIYVSVNISFLRL